MLITVEVHSLVSSCMTIEESFEILNAIGKILRVFFPEK